MKVSSSALTPGGSGTPAGGSTLPENPVTTRSPRLMMPSWACVGAAWNAEARTSRHPSNRPVSNPDPAPHRLAGAPWPETGPEKRHLEMIVMGLLLRRGHILGH